MVVITKRKALVVGREYQPYATYSKYFYVFCASVLNQYLTEKMELDSLELGKAMTLQYRWADYKALP